MSAVALQATPLLYDEGLAYWDELTLQCRRHVNAINAVAAQHSLPEQYRIAWQPGPLSVTIVREAYPTTEINLRLDFKHWGPSIIGSVNGYRDEDHRFYPDEFEHSIGCDEDETPVVITGEGLSLTPHAFAKCLAQNFRRCFPGISLPSLEKASD